MIQKPNVLRYVEPRPPMEKVDKQEVDVHKLQATLQTKTIMETAHIFEIQEYQIRRIIKEYGLTYPRKKTGRKKGGQPAIEAFSGSAYVKHLEDNVNGQT